METANRSALRFLPLLLKAYVVGTLCSAFTLHVAISIIAPGDGGTMLALGDVGLFLVEIMVLSIVAAVALPIAALVSWPLRSLVIRRPLLALSLACGTGLAIGGIVTFAYFRAGPDDFWSGPLVGASYGIVWFLMVYRSTRREGITIA
jgi:hypothetical protein